MILKNDFSLVTMTRSDTAKRKGYNEQWVPPDYVCNNLAALFQHLLLPLVNNLPGDIHVTGAYRCSRLNVAVGSKPTSQHLTGQAADIEYWENGIEKNKIIIDTVLRLNLPFDQMINENNLSWVHLSYSHVKARKQFFKLPK
ncbi:MAG: D-Ala-D-Ala carboxypeptidase family metallohydrolase [Bacteroidales bacterium]|nr:D-Ala-D-Ala carboxypeptidase family metallohydrolase [Bacteroidales bacterium]